MLVCGGLDVVIYAEQCAKAYKSGNKGIQAHRVYQIKQVPGYAYERKRPVRAERHRPASALQGYLPLGQTD